MKKISGSTFYFKKLFPAVWFGFLGFFLLVGLLVGAPKKDPMLIIMPLLMAGFGFLLFKKLVWDLADHVYDNGDEQIFLKGRKEQRVALRDIINVGYSHMMSPERIVIMVRSDGPIGKELVFTPPLRFNPFAKSPLVYELIERVDQARNA